MSKSGWLVVAVALMSAAGIIGRYLYKTPNYTLGAQVPAIAEKLPDGSDFNLEQLRGRYVLLDFWGSWCGPCIKELPAVSALYQEFSRAVFTDAAGFDIVSIAAEQDLNRWKSAVATYQLNWPYHIVSTNMFDAPAFKQYGVRVIPTKLLLSPDGQVIGYNQTPEQIKGFLAARLKTD
jgi:thiol-disulfide isomerase/thioredoxin